jgi:hypothetical protein
MNAAQEFALNRHGLSKHSMRNGYVISKASDGWVLTAPDGSTEFHIHSLALARIEADYA